LKNKINLIFDWRMKLKTKINLVKGSKNIQKNENQNWHKNKKQYFDWRVKLKRIIIFIKGPRKKIKMRTMRIKLENIIPSIWIEWWNWKLMKLLYKGQEKKN
jgi:hypothetical protein